VGDCGICDASRGSEKEGRGGRKGKNVKGGLYPTKGVSTTTGEQNFKRKGVDRRY